MVGRLFAQLAAEIATATGDNRTPEQVAEGFLQIAVANMANAVKKISVQKGHDVTRYALTTFGGAGGQHACAVADALGIRTVLVPPMAGVLSALRHRPGRRHRNARAVRRAPTLTPTAMPHLREMASGLRAAGRANSAPTGGATGPHPTSPAARTCATTAPTPHSRSRSPSRPR